MFSSSTSTMIPPRSLNQPSRKQHWKPETIGPSIGYEMTTADTYQTDPLRLREAIWENQAWAVVAIMPNATTLLRQAVEQGILSYGPMGAAQFVYVEARNQMTIDSYIMPQLQQLATQVQAKFGAQWATQIVSNTTIRTSAANLERVPQAINPAIGFTMITLRPFTPLTATPAVSIGLIYLLIILFFSFSFFVPIHIDLLKPEGYPPLKSWQLIPWMWCASMLFYFLASCFYSLTSLALQIPF